MGLRHLACLAWALATALGATPVRGQLRPLDPLDWAALANPGASVELGTALLGGQYAPLAGTRGRLWEVGTMAFTWSVGRASVTAAGAARLIFRDRQILAPPTADARPPDGSVRRDRGVVSVSAALLLAGTPDRQALGLRLGARLPTGENTVGLSRDQTDFFSTLAGIWSPGSWRISGEAGLAILGTRLRWQEQVDQLFFAARGLRILGRWRPYAEVVGRHDTRPGEEIRGVEGLGEIRLGTYLGHRRWLRVEGLRGWTPQGPDWGVRLMVGAAF